MTIALEGWRKFWSPCHNGAPPANDDFADALVITGSSGTTDGIYIGCATTEPGEPTGTNILATPCWQTIWYEWTAPANGTATIDTDNSTCPMDNHSLWTVDGNNKLDTTLAVWTGATLGTLVEVASNDDQDYPTPDNNWWSEVSFAATMGAVYKIQVGAAGFLFVGTSRAIYAGAVVLNWNLV